MNYEVLNKVTKAELIRWLRKNVFLPRISDEEFLRQVALETLFEKAQALLFDDEMINKQLEENKNDPVKFMELLAAGQTISDEFNKVNAEIDALLRRGEQ